MERWNTGNLTKAFSAINDRIGANPADYIEVTVAMARVMVKAIDPTKRENVDEYEYGGAALQVSPVDVSHKEPGIIEASKFKSDTVNPRVLSGVLASAVMDAGVEDGEVVTLTVEKAEANDPQPRITVGVRAPRGGKLVRYKLSGELIGVA